MVKRLGANLKLLDLVFIKKRKSRGERKEGGGVKTLLFTTSANGPTGPQAETANAALACSDSGGLIMF
jgi:hypothetical protein